MFTFSSNLNLCLPSSVVINKWKVHLLHIPQKSPLLKNVSRTKLCMCVYILCKAPVVSLSVNVFEERMTFIYFPIFIKACTAKAFKAGYHSHAFQL